MYTKDYSNKDTMSLLTIAIQNVPTMRYHRTLAKTTLDLVVSIGGVFGLFFGASVLSLVEFIYIWLVRSFSHTY